MILLMAIVKRARAADERMVRYIRTLNNNDVSVPGVTKLGGACQLMSVFPA